MAATRIGFWTWIWSTRHWTGAGSSLFISILQKHNWFCLTGLITMVLLMWNWMDLFLRKIHLKMLGLTFSSKSGWGSYIISIAKAATKKIGSLFLSMKFFSPEVGLYLYSSTIRPCMEYCCHFWAGTTSCYLELLDKLQKRTCKTVGPSLAASLECLAHQRNVASLVFSIGINGWTGSTSFFSREDYSLFW